MPYQSPSTFLNTSPFAGGLVDGAGDEFLVGIDKIQVGGIENPIEFNGYKINQRGNADVIMVTSIDGLSDADIRDSRDVNPGYDGETAFSSYYGGRTIVLNGFIRAGTLTKFRNMQEGLKRIFAPLEEKELIFKGPTAAKDIVIYCRKTQPIVMSEAQTNYEFRRDFQVTLRASDFRFFAKQIEEFAWAFGSAFNGTYEIGSVINKGSYLADPIIKIEGPLVAATNGGDALTIENTIQSTLNNTLSIYGQTIGYALSQSSASGGLDMTHRNKIIIKAPSTSTEVLAAGDFLLINCSKKTAQFYDSNGDFVSSAFSVIDKNSEWMSLAPGSNPISVTTYTSTEPKITIYHRHTFL